MSQARARYLKAQRDYDHAVESEKAARLASDAQSPELNVATIGLEYAGQELVRARENFYSAFRENLASHDPEFRRLEANANAAQQAYQQARLMVDELRRVLSSALTSPSGIHALDQETRELHFALLKDSRELAKAGLEVVKEKLGKLGERAEEHQGRAYCYLEAALAREEGRAA